MPELPEVETIKNDLDKKVTGKVITDFCLLSPNTLKEITLTKFKKLVIGKKILRVKRRAKTIIMKIEGEHSIIFHMMMTGHLLVIPSAEKTDKSGDWQNKKGTLKDPFNQYIRAIFTVNSNTLIAFSDIRKFGFIKILKLDEVRALEEKYGPEPLSAFFDKKYLQKKFSEKKTSVKKALMDQSLIGGIGNIYADEILFKSKIHPEKITTKITENEITDIVKNTKTILKKAIKLRGTSTSDFRDTDGKKGRYKDMLKAYGKTNTPCETCGTAIKKIVVGGRGTHYCPKCQREND